MVRRRSAAFTGGPEEMDADDLESAIGAFSGNSPGSVQDALRFYYIHQESLDQALRDCSADWEEFKPVFDELESQFASEYDDYEAMNTGRER